MNTGPTVAHPISRHLMTMFLASTYPLVAQVRAVVAADQTTLMTAAVPAPRRAALACLVEEEHLAPQSAARAGATAVLVSNMVAVLAALTTVVATAEVDCDYNAATCQAC